MELGLRAVVLALATQATQAAPVLRIQHPTRGQPIQYKVLVWKRTRKQQLPLRWRIQSQQQDQCLGTITGEAEAVVEEVAEGARQTSNEG